MAVVNVLVRRPPERVWEVLADGGAYAEWVVGTREVRSVGAGFPAVGSRLDVTVGFGPLSYHGSTTVRHLEQGRSLGLEANGGALGTARIMIELMPWGEDTVVEIDESPLRGPGYRLHNALSDAFVLLRGHLMVRQLARLVERRTPR